MKISIVVSDPTSGLLFHPVRLALALGRRGHEVSAISWTRNGQNQGLAEELESARIPLSIHSVLEYPGMKGMIAGVWPNISEDLKEACDLLFTFGAVGAWQMRRLAGRRGRSVAIIESLGSGTRRYWGPRAAASVLNRCCNKVVALCRLEKSRLESLGVDPNRICVIPNPVDWRRLLSMAEASKGNREATLLRLNLDPGRRHVGCLANFNPMKRQDLLIMAFAEVASLFPDFDIVFCGHGPEMQRCQDLAKELGVASRTHFLGLLPNNEVISLMAHLDACTLTSSMETFGFSFVEPLLFSKPVLATRVGIAWEMEEAGVALVVPPENLQATTRGLRQMLMLDKQVMSMASQGPSFVKENFDVDTVADLLVSAAYADHLTCS